MTNKDISVPREQRDEFLNGPDEEGIDALDNEIESLDIWREVAADPGYNVATARLTWREVSEQLAERGLRLARLVKELRSPTVPRDETDAAFEAVREALECCDARPMETVLHHDERLRLGHNALTTIQDEMKRLREERKPGGVFHSLQSQLTETRDQLEEAEGMAEVLRNQLEKERAVGDALGADLWEARKAALSLRDQLEKAEAALARYGIYDSESRTALDRGTE